MRRAPDAVRVTLLGLAATAVAADAASAGGFAVREQSAHHQGASFAGNGAGGDLSSMFWNPAALGLMGAGFQTQSSYSLIVPESDMTAKAGTTFFGAPGTVNETDSGRAAIVPASYAGYRLSPDLALGVSLSAPFGLGSEPDTEAWVGGALGRSAKLTTYNLTTMAAYRVAPGLFIGGGVQFEYAKLLFKFAGGFPPTAPSAGIDIEDKLGIGYTAGVLWQPTSGTSIGLGFRSSITHDFEGDTFFNTQPFGGPVEAKLETPETVTLSLRQALAPNWRGLATIEWSNWSRFDQIPITCAGPGVGPPPFNCAGANFAVLEANWHDGWFYALGLEHDYTPNLTLRAGIAYEKSPVQNPSERLPQVPDSDRVWLSAGLSYQLFQNTTIDLAYTHIFLEDAGIDRGALTNPAVRLVADREANVDIVSVGLKMTWGGAPAPAPLK